MADMPDHSTKTADSAADDELGSINYAWLANNTLAVASFLISVIKVCRPYLALRASSALGGVHSAARFFETLRFRYINIIQRPRWTLAAHEKAFDAAVYRLFFGGAVVPRPQQLTNNVLSCRVSIVCYLEDPEAALHSLQQIARAFVQLEQQIREVCILHSVNPAGMSQVQYEW